MTAKRDIFIETHTLHYSLVYGSIYSKVGDPDIAEDLCQEVFLAFWENLESIREHRPWLLGTMRNVVLNHYKRKHSKDLDIADLFDDMALTFVNGMRDARIIIGEIIDHGNVFGDELDRAIFEMVAINLYSYAETAKDLGTTKRTVEYRYRKIADTIVSRLRDRGIKHLEDIL